MGNDDQRGLKKYLVGTVILGALFLSVQAYEYSELIHGGLVVSGTLFGACFFTLTGFHGAHVTIGVLCMIFVTVKAFRGGYSQEDHTGVEIIGAVLALCGSCLDYTLYYRLFDMTSRGIELLALTLKKMKIAKITFCVLT